MSITATSCAPQPVCILACSPRAQGNSDHMAALFAKGVRQGGEKYGLQAHIYALRDYHILPCTGCNACFSHGKCVWQHKDDVTELFTHMSKASHTFWASPIFFYHLPAVAKAFMDRAQQFWAQHAQNTKLSPKHHNVSVGLVAARSKGDNLFTGSLWSLHYFFALFNKEIKEKHLFTGHDGPKDFINDSAACARIEEAGYLVGKHISPPKL